MPTTPRTRPTQTREVRGLRARSRGALLLLLTLSLSSSAVVFAAPPALVAGAAAPAFQLPARSGTAALDSLRGDVVLVDFWASWCGPCRQSFPWLAELQKRLQSRGLRVVAVNLDKSRAAADQFLARYEVPFTVAFDPAGATAERYGVRAMPTSVLVDRAGRVVRVHAGFEAARAADWAAAIEAECAK